MEKNMTYKNITSKNDEQIEQMIRVNQAGEFGAKRIYEGQLLVLKNDKKYKIIKKMANQEEEHLKTFNKIMIEKGVRPTILSPLWNIGGFVLGATTAFISTEAAMACTVAVEEVIDKHYEAQRLLLKKKKREKKLLKTIEKFRLEELEHKNIALKNDAEKTKNYRSLTRGIKVITSIAIFLSKKI